MAQRTNYHGSNGGTPGRDRSQTGAEEALGESWERDCQFKRALTDAASLNEDVIGQDLSFDGISVVERFATQISIAGSTMKQQKISHSEVICEWADPMHGLLKLCLNLKRRPWRETNSMASYDTSVHISRHESPGGK